jgi:hypothetical protein
MKRVVRAQTRDGMRIVDGEGGEKLQDATCNGAEEKWQDSKDGQVESDGVC